MPYIESSILIKGNADDIYNMAKDMEKFPLYMPDVESVKVLERSDNSTISEWVTNVEGTPIIWKEVDHFDDKKRLITYRLIEGDLDKFEGTWTFSETPEGTLVVLGVDYDFGIPALTELIGPTLELKVRENSEMMLNGMKERFEEKK